MGIVLISTQTHFRLAVDAPFTGGEFRTSTDWVSTESCRPVFNSLTEFAVVASATLGCTIEYFTWIFVASHISWNRTKSFILSKQTSIIVDARSCFSTWNAQTNDCFRFKNHKYKVNMSLVRYSHLRKLGHLPVHRRVWTTEWVENSPWVSP